VEDSGFHVKGFNIGGFSLAASRGAAVALMQLSPGLASPFVAPL